MKLNENYFNLKENYLFAEVAHRVSEYRAAHPEQRVISLGIGDVTLPLPESAVAALQKAVDEQSRPETFRGYGPERGYAFLREAVRDYYAEKGVSLEADEIFVSDGAKSDLGNMTELFGKSRVLMPDPVYPAYYDVNVMAGNEIHFSRGTVANGFLPAPPDDGNFDIIYLCSPSNPTGAVYNKEQLREWVDYALRTGAVIFFDAAYESFVRDSELPTSIYLVDGAEKCAIEFCSFSKTAGFTGLRCGYTVVPKAIADGKLNAFWNRRQTTKFNGVPYIVQRAAEAVLTPQGRKETARNIGIYIQNAQVIHNALEKAGIPHTGGVNSPYVWMQCPAGKTSWEFFDILLTEAQVVGTPGSGFGEEGEGWFRLTAFGDRADTVTAAERLGRLCAQLRAEEQA